MGLEERIVLDDEVIEKGDLIEVFNDKEKIRGYFFGYREKGNLVYISLKQDSNWDTAYCLDFYKVRKVD